MKNKEQPLSIGIIDDDQIFTAIASMQLQVQFPNASVQIANQPDDALWIKEVDILFLDINLRDCTAWDIIKSKRDQLIDLKLILCSSSVDIDDISRAQNTKEVDGYVIKPMSPSKIKAAFDGHWPSYDVAV